MTPGLSFIKDFEAEVHVQYQQIGSKLRNTVRTKDSVIGATTTFQKVGKGTVSTKARHDMVPVECVLQDVYAGDWIDKLDELKTNINEQQFVARLYAYMLGRKSDELIINELARPTNFVGTETEGLTKTKVLKAIKALDAAEMPNDGQRYAVVGWKQWDDLLDIDEFDESDYIDDKDLPHRDMNAKCWLDIIWFPHAGLPKTASVRSCFLYHKTAIGHAVGSDVKSDITWHGDRAAHFVNNSMSQGACLIDPNGVVTLRCIES